MPDATLGPNLTIYFEEQNPRGAPVVLLLHGLGVTGSSWQLQFPALVQAGFRVLAPDARGFGKSSYPGRGEKIATTAGDFVRLLQALETGPAHVVGISMGGTHALQIAVDHPGLVSKLVLVNTFAKLRPPSLRGWIYFAYRFVLVHTIGLPYQARFVAKSLFPQDDQELLRQVTVEQILQADPRGYRAAMRALGRFNLLSRLNEVKAPTLVVTGENDTTVPPENQRALVTGILHARQVIIPNAGHAVIIDQAEIFNRLLVDFLTDTGDSSTSEEKNEP